MLLLLAACKEVAIITRFHVNNRIEIAVVTNKYNNNNAVVTNTYMIITLL